MNHSDSRIFWLKCTLGVYTSRPGALARLNPHILARVTNKPEPAGWRARCRRGLARMLRGAGSGAASVKGL